MLYLNKFLLCILVAGMVFNSASAATSSQIIDGFSEFIIERADANLIAVFERRLKNDKNFQCYFPNTYEKIDSIKLENLFSSKTYWEEGLDNDLEELIYRSLLVEVQQSLKFFSHARVKEFVDLDRAILTLQHFEYSQTGSSYPLDSIDPGLPKPLRQEINGFSYSFAKLSELIRGIDKQVLVRNVCEVRNKGRAELQQVFDPYIEAGNELINWIQHVERYAHNVRLSSLGKQVLYCRHKNIASGECATAQFDEKKFIQDLLQDFVPEELRRAVAAAERINNAFTVIKQFTQKEADIIQNIELLLPTLQNERLDSAELQKIEGWLNEAEQLTRNAVEGWKIKRKKLFVQVLASIKQKVDSDDADAIRITGQLREFIEGKSLQSYSDRALVSLELLEDSDLFNSPSYGRLRNAVLFFAAIADAEDKNGVKSILQAYTLPPVSFAEKRKQGEGVFISSYLGITYADFDSHGSTEQASTGGLFAPVGIEFSYGFDNGGSWSVLLSPIDMAFPINLKLSGIEEEVEFEELVAPSITLAYGFQDYPFNVGVGYQRGRTLGDVGAAEDGYLLFLSFDMPLFRLY
ncbi:MAG: hypothetical protein GY784_05010 [Gammaproteobacteria bacterium]|nr:hypothetical protein [Gammaproteobacteria bacterium]